VPPSKPERRRHGRGRYVNHQPTGAYSLPKALALDEQRNIVSLFLARIEVRPSEKSGTPVPTYTRLLKLRMKLRVGRLIKGMAEQVVIEERTSLAASADPDRIVQLAHAQWRNTRRNSHGITPTLGETGRSGSWGLRGRHFACGFSLSFSGGKVHGPCLSERSIAIGVDVLNVAAAPDRADNTQKPESADSDEGVPEAEGTRCPRQLRRGEKSRRCSILRQRV
jgi:hypothetical protein